MSDDERVEELIHKLIDEGFTPIESEGKMAKDIRVDPELLTVVDTIVDSKWGKSVSSRSKTGVIARLFTAEIRTDPELRGERVAVVADSSGETEERVDLSEYLN